MEKSLRHTTERTPFEIERSEKSLWWLITISLTSCGDNYTSCKIIYFTLCGENS